MADAVVFEDVVKSFGKFRALDGLSFRIREGEMYGLLGPNGAGKTTAIRILNGLLRPTAGRVHVLGHDARDVALRPLVGYMPQETALYLDLTVNENLALFGRLYGMEPQRREARIAELLELVDLSKWGDSLITQLSGGMKHRASLAAALMPGPRLLVLDEPTVGVDPELRATFWARFGEMAAQGTTILITTHYMDEARRCGRVGFVRGGRLIAEDTPTRIMEAAGVDNLEDAFLRMAARRPAGAEA